MTHHPGACAHPKNQINTLIFGNDGSDTSAFHVAKRLAGMFRRKYQWSEIDFDSEANLELVEAAHKFRPGSNAKFSSYAYKCIEQRLKNLVRDTQLAKRKPKTLQELSDAGFYQEQVPCQGECLVALSKHLESMPSKSSKKGKIIDLLMIDVASKDIAEIVGTSPARISQIARELFQAA